MQDSDSWRFYTIQHSKGDKINLYVRERDGSVEIYITDEIENRILIHDSLAGFLGEVYLDQYLTVVPWKTTERIFKEEKIEFDMVQVRVEKRYKDGLDYLKYHIANAINISRSNQNFPQHIRKNIIGTWISENFKLKFEEDGQYLKTGKEEKKNILFSCPTFGSWDITNNQCYLMNEGSGIRIQIIDIDENKLIFPGNKGQLFYLMRKK